MKQLTGKMALVTGASRGIGAEVAVGLADKGADVVINYRSKASRAEAVANRIHTLDATSLLAQADICELNDLNRMYQSINEEMGKLDILILNASGGLEKGKTENYAMRLNHDAQCQLVDGELPLMAEGGEIIFVTSHLAHFYGEKPVYEGYKTVAASKHAGEQALKQRIADFSKKGIRFQIVSGDLIEGTITPKLMQRGNRGLIEERRKKAGSLPTIHEFAAAIVETATNKERPTGSVIYVGSID